MFFSYNSEGHIWLPEALNELRQQNYLSDYERDNITEESFAEKEKLIIESSKGLVVQWLIITGGT